MIMSRRYNFMLFKIGSFDLAPIRRVLYNVLLNVSKREILANYFEDRIVYVSMCQLFSFRPSTALS